MFVMSRVIAHVCVGGGGANLTIWSSDWTGRVGWLVVGCAELLVAPGLQRGDYYSVCAHRVSDWG